MNTINDILSRLRDKAKAVNKDGFVTDRFLYSSVRKFVPGLLKREDAKNLLFTIQGIFQVLPYVEMIDADKIDSNCIKIPGCSTIKRSLLRLPNLYMGYAEPMIKSITSISGPATNAQDEGDFQLIEASKYASIVKVKSFKYNTTRYAWYSDGYLWTPNLPWDAVRIEGLFDESIEGFNCNHCKVCRPRQEDPFSVPEYLYPEIEQFVFQDLGIMMKIPADPTDDKINLARQ